MPMIRRSPQSKVDFLEIWLYLAEKSGSVEPANDLVRSIEAAIVMLSENPGMGATRDDLRKGMRSWPVDNYLIFYLPLPKGIELARIVHGARDLRKVFRRRRLSE